MNLNLYNTTPISSQNGFATHFIEGAASAEGAGNGTIGSLNTFLAGADGTTTMTVRADIIVDSSTTDTTGATAGFAVVDSTASGGFHILRAMNQTTELAGGTGRRLGGGRSASARRH